MVVGERQLRRHVGLLVLRRHVEVGVGAVSAVVEVEKGKRVEIGDDGLPRPVLVEDGQEGELSTVIAVEFACKKPGVGLTCGMVGLGGRKDEMRVSRHQFERISTPVIAHGYSQVPFLLC
jgi:hypothetical protein